MKIKGYKKDGSVIKESGQITLRRLLKPTVLALIVIGFAYVFQMNSIVAQGYELSELESGNQEKIKDNQGLKTKISGQTSFTHLSDVTKALKLVPAEQIVYLKLVDDKPALAKAEGAAH